MSSAVFASLFLYPDTILSKARDVTSGERKADEEGCNDGETHFGRS